MKKPLIKICGIKNTLLLKDMAVLGVHFIGLVFHPASKRYLDIETAKKIAAIAKENGLISVAVFVNQTAAEMMDVIKQTNVDMIQLHGDTCKSEHHLLPENYKRIYAQGVGEDGDVLLDKAGGLQYCQPTRDYLLFDNIQAGSGKKFTWEKFSYQGEFKWFVAGGLTPDNVSEAVSVLQPDAVDVSGGVEDIVGEKDLKLVSDFIHVLKIT